jgi:hypothetical protein
VEQGAATGGMSCAAMCGGGLYATGTALLGSRAAVAVECAVPGRASKVAAIPEERLPERLCRCAAAVVDACGPQHRSQGWRGGCCPW